MFLFMAQKESSSWYGPRGCIEDYGSDFFMQNKVTHDGLIQLWAEYLHRNMNLQTDETGYYFSIFKNGIQVFGKDGVMWDADEDQKRKLFPELQEQDDRKEMTLIAREGSILACEKQAEQVEKIARDKQEEESRQKEERRLQRLKQFETLKKEFG